MAIGEKAVSILIPLHRLSTKRHVSLMTTSFFKFQSAATISHCSDKIAYYTQVGVWLLSLIFASQGEEKNRPCYLLPMADAS